MSVTSLRLKYTRLCLVYIHNFWHMPLMVQLRWSTQRTENDGKLKSKDIEDS